MGPHQWYAVILLDQIVDPINGLHNVWWYAMNAATIGASTQFYVEGQPQLAPYASAPAAAGLTPATYAANNPPIMPVQLVGPGANQAATNAALLAALQPKAQDLATRIASGNPFIPAPVPPGTVAGLTLVY